MLIGFAGKAETGKSTAASLLQIHAPQADFRIKSFATKLKKIVAVLTNQTLEDVDKKQVHPTLCNGKYTNRELLQIIGTDLFRKKFYPDIWVDSLFCTYHKRWNWLIDDVRFENEILAIKNLGGVIVYLNRKTNNNMSHESENALPDPELYPSYYDYIIQNNGTRTDLLKALLYIYDLENLKTH